MIFPQPPEPYDVKLAGRYRLLTLTLLEALNRQDEAEMNALFGQREVVMTELAAIPNLGEAAIKLLNESQQLNARFTAELAALQGRVAEELIAIYHGDRSTKQYRRDPNVGLSGLEQTG
ncbi:MAG: hypothetical protein JNJ45_00130 [Chthonomonas sp.]|nr:hypothetical protein [Chthonomonas sp.]